MKGQLVVWNFLLGENGELWSVDNWVMQLNSNVYNTMLKIVCVKMNFISSLTNYLPGIPSNEVCCINIMLTKK